MDVPEYTQVKPINLKSHPTLDERWVQARLAEDPSLLGLGELILKDKERIQPRAGRLDLLFQDPESARRYETEVQLGATDETHIIRTIEYWDIERRRYPQYEHCAVIVAEDITARFLNVLALFNGQIPLIAVQMRAIETASGVALLFTTVLNEMTLGLVDEDEDIQEPTDRRYWLDRSNNEIMSILDRSIEMIREFAPGYDLNYNKHYVGLTKSGKTNNFTSFAPKRSFTWFRIKIPKSDETDRQLEEAGLDDYQYSRWGTYQIRIRPKELKANEQLIASLLKAAYEHRSA